MNLFNINRADPYRNDSWSYEAKHKIVAIVSAVFTIASIGAFFSALCLTTPVLIFTVSLAASTIGLISFFTFFYSAMEAGLIPGFSSVDNDEYF